jgi:hypothetical protein
MMRKGRRQQQTPEDAGTRRTEHPLDHRSCTALERNKPVTGDGLGKSSVHRPRPPCPDYTLIFDAQ